MAPTLNIAFPAQTLKNQNSYHDELMQLQDRYLKSESKLKQASSRQAMYER